MIWVYIFLVYTITIVAEILFFDFLSKYLEWNMCVEGCATNFVKIISLIALFILPTINTITFFFFHRKKIKFKYWLLVLLGILIANLILAYLATDYGYAHTTDPLAP
ncbi:hypothetical protein LVJ85_10155 [Neisseria sp. Dent CA1/247]|uniref:hypothetical protein n=1 Tax=Neisseria TaxID=482 RepID=UPI001FD5B404|nr:MULTISPECIES: hypothetical protein [Neisseria]MDO5070624.1 hypothetical protein [Neisseria zoodegmatis]UOO76377.1 hypothetical protein LVJ85_10155 [Neisseria sp. Dent CA1/247]